MQPESISNLLVLPVAVWKLPVKQTEACKVIGK